MMASNASHTTRINMTMPAMKTPALGIIRSIVLALSSRGAWSESRNELRVYGNFGFVELGNGAAGFGAFYGGVEFGLIRAGDGGDEVQVALGDAEALANFFERNGAGGLEFRGGHSSAAELGGECHGETACVCRGEQFFWVGAYSIFKAGAE